MDKSKQEADTLTQLGKEFKIGIKEYVLVMNNERRLTQSIKVLSFLLYKTKFLRYINLKN